MKLLPEVLTNPQVVERFLREAQAAVRLKSEHVARVIDVGSLETGAPYMVLEYLDGVGLAHFPRSHLTVGLIVDLMLQACEALAEAHALGIIQRGVPEVRSEPALRRRGRYRAPIGILALHPVLAAGEPAGLMLAA
jgi:serine/threonine protein kinase